MNPSDELFQLIKSMSKSEKRFFKLMSSLQTGAKNYVRLFDAIELQETYNEAAIRKELKRETFIKHLPSEKNHLHKLIMKSLRAYHANISMSAQLKEQINDIEVLFDKALYKQCRKALEKVKKQAYFYEKFYLILEIINLEKKLIDMEAHFGMMDIDLNDLLEKENKVIEQSGNFGKYQIIFSKLNYWVRQKMVMRNSKEQSFTEYLLNEPLMQDESRALSISAKIVFHHIKGMYYMASGSGLDKTLVHFTALLKLMDTYPQMAKEMSKRYLSAINNIVFCHLAENKYEKCFNNIDKMRSLLTLPEFASIDLQLKIFTSSYNAELLIYNDLGEFDKAVKLVNPIAAGLKKYEGKINTEEVVIFYYNISAVYFGNGDFHKALLWNNKILNEREKELRQDLYGFSRLLNLIIHYELGNTQLIEYEIRSVIRLYSSKDKTHKFEHLVLEYIRKLIKVKRGASTETIFLDFKKEMEILIEDKFERVALEFFDFISWIESKTEKITFAQAIRRKRKYGHVIEII
ncbi:MAG: hypothetical protein ABI199_00460 [Bacteroidia bacterium]